MTALNTHMVNIKSDGECEDRFWVIDQMINGIQKNPARHLHAAMVLVDKTMKFQLDCGASCNIILRLLVNLSFSQKKPTRCYVSSHYIDMWENVYSKLLTQEQANTG